MPESFLRQAIDLAVESVALGGGPFGAIVVRDDRVIGRGQNRVVPTADPTAHAEVLAIRDACQTLGTHDLSGCELFASCEPCPMCLGALQWARIATIHYASTRDDAAGAGFDDARFFAEFGQLVERRIELHPTLRAEAQAAFRAWNAAEDRAPY